MHHQFTNVLISLPGGPELKCSDIHHLPGFHWYLVFHRVFHLSVNRLDIQWPPAAVEMGLIYVNPEGLDGNPAPVTNAQE